MSSPQKSVSKIGPGESGFWFFLSALTGLYLIFILALLQATATYATPGDLLDAMESREIRYAVTLSLFTCSVTALLSLVLAVPAGYLLARSKFPGKSLVEAALDIPIVLPPMVIGLCLLIFFQTPAGHFIEKGIPFTYTVYGVVLAQLVIGAAFAIHAHAGNFRSLVLATGRCGHDLGLFPRRSRLSGHLTSSVERHDRCHERGLGTESGRVWTHPGFCWCDPDEDGGVADHRLVGTQRRQS